MDTQRCSEGLVGYEGYGEGSSGLQHDGNKSVQVAVDLWVKWGPG